MADILVNGERVHYRVSSHAPQEAAAAVCIHGSGADGVVWTYQVSRLRKEYRIIAPDLPGHGRSAGALLETAADYADWLHDFIGTLGLHRFFLIGHSFGGAVVQEYARMHPECVIGIVLVGTGTAFTLSRTYRSLVEQGDAIEKDVCDAHVPESFREGYAFLKNNSSAALHADLLAAGRFDSRPWISSIAMPALVMRGGSDCITPPEMPAELARLLPEAELAVINGAGHVVMLEARNAFNSLLRGFFESIAEREC